MEDLKKIDHFTLLDRLSWHTKEYMRMFKDRTRGEEFSKCKHMIEKITYEIEFRKKQRSHTN